MFHELLANSNILPATKLEALIRQSYDLVAANAPKKKATGKKRRQPALQEIGGSPRGLCGSAFLGVPRVSAVNSV